MSDIYGRVGVIQSPPIFEELLRAFDTRPPIRERGGIMQRHEKVVRYSTIAVIGVATVVLSLSVLEQQ